MTEKETLNRKSYVVPSCIVWGGVPQAVLCTSPGKPGDDDDYNDYPDVF